MDAQEEKWESLSREVEFEAARSMVTGAAGDQSLIKKGIVMLKGLLTQSDVTPSELVAIRFCLAIAYESLYEFDEALRQLEHVLMINSSHKEAIKARARVEKSKKQELLLGGTIGVAALALGVIGSIALFKLARSK